TAVTEGVAWAELLVPVERAREPLTAESEAEKPTRARRAVTRKKDGNEAPEAEVELELELETETGEAVEAEAAETGEADGEAAAPKKRTRRGTRGGRNRKRKTGAAA